MATAAPAIASNMILPPLRYHIGNSEPACQYRNRFFYQFFCRYPQPGFVDNETFQTPHETLARYSHILIFLRPSVPVVAPGVTRGP